MDRYGYVLRRDKERKGQEDTRYHRGDLLGMTTFQLREICRREKLVQGIVDPMDKEALIRVIMRYRGAEDSLLIREPDEDGLRAVEELLKEARIKERHDLHLTCSAKITAYEGLAIGIYDGLTLPYDKELAGTNALVVGGDGTVCTVLNVVPLGTRTDRLYLTKDAQIPCRRSGVREHSLYCLRRKESEMVYHLYRDGAGRGPDASRDRGQDAAVGRGQDPSGARGSLSSRSPAVLEVYKIPLLDFEVRQPIPLSLPMAIDLGTSATTAGVYLDERYFERAGLQDGERGLKKDGVNHALFYDLSSDQQETPLLPSVAGIQDLGGEEPVFVFGYDALRLADAGPVDEGIRVFHDIKRWIGDPERMEEVTDRQGRRGQVARKEILRAYLLHVVQAVRDRFKCSVEGVHFSCPVKQKGRASRLFTELLPGYMVEKEEMIDEGVSVLYDTIGEMIDSRALEDGAAYKALIIDCGGGTTDLCSCRFRFWDERVAYRIEIDTAYEDGDTDLGGNNLTYRIMQLIKIAMAQQLGPTGCRPLGEILAEYDQDVFRYVDSHGAGAVYRELDGAYEEAGAAIPTRFKASTHRSREEYRKVEGNFYLLFGLAEKVKRVFYDHVGTLRVALSPGEVAENATVWIPVDRWRLSVRKGGELETLRDSPTVYISIYELELLLKADIYGVIRRFMERMEGEDELGTCSIIKLTGRSCKIDIFRDALKEFVPGRAIRSRRRSGDPSRDLGLKMACVDGALRYLKDKRYGFADIRIRTGEPALPYRITAFTHDGGEVVLIHRLQRGRESGTVSRNMEDLTLELYLKDVDGRERYRYTCRSALADLKETLYEGIREQYGEHIRQADTDTIIDREVKFFVWAEPDGWAFSVVPVCRKDGSLYLGKEERFYFEDEGWMQDFFGGER